ncbi:hypothetical protein [Chryseobacterium sp. CT-SW4]|uniref:hypothetical protein n=1 Tax=Chryseobacterium sp. SW-1 TaxID=3157343 RepID=UPI003B01DFFD
MSLNEITMWLLGEYVADDPEDFESLYNDSMELIRGAAVEKNIEFDDYYLSRWKTAADNIVNFDEKYFSDNEKRDLYVFLSAQIDQDIYSYLEYIWHIIYSEKLTMKLIENKAKILIEKGVKF